MLRYFITRCMNLYHGFIREKLEPSGAHIFLVLLSLTPLMLSWSVHMSRKSIDTKFMASEASVPPLYQDRTSSFPVQFWTYQWWLCNLYANVNMKISAGLLSTKNTPSPDRTSTRPSHHPVGRCLLSLECRFFVVSRSRLHYAYNLLAFSGCLLRRSYFWNWTLKVSQISRFG